MPGSPPDGIRTQALREATDASRPVDAASRSRADDLARLEGMLARGPGSWIGSVVLGTLRARYPVEAIRMEAEIRSGALLTVEEAERELTRRWSRGDPRGTWERRVSEARSTPEAQALNAWIAAGGRP